MHHGAIAFFLLAFAIMAVAAASARIWAGVVGFVLALLAVVLVLAGVIPA